jgi:hypothetical protein
MLKIPSWIPRSRTPSINRALSLYWCHPLCKISPPSNYWVWLIQIPGRTVVGAGYPRWHWQGSLTLCPCSRLTTRMIWWWRRVVPTRSNLTSHLARPLVLRNPGKYRQHKWLTGKDYCFSLVSTSVMIIKRNSWRRYQKKRLMCHLKGITNINFIMRGVAETGTMITHMSKCSTWEIALNRSSHL